MANNTAGDTQAEAANFSGDYLGYSVYAQTLWARIEAALNKDLNCAALGDDPLVVGIFGEWGAGKSKLLKLIEVLAKSKLAAAAQQAPGNGPPTLTVPVYFQPWKYEHEKHLLVPLMLHLVQATQEALKSAPTFKQQLVAMSRDADSAVSKAAGAAHTAAQTARKWFPVLKKVVGSLSLFGVSIAFPDEIDDWLQDAETVFASPEAKAQGRAASAKELRRKQLAYVDNGFHYYQLHELLQDLTRPGRAEHTQDLANGTSATDLRLNFVIFIDDLDRCLPEKAVETLELIKTIFNLESFAFVLALDEEVVERGIGHRYKDYALANKKPEMPITGFEYLEKIVHLPFRLPGLSRSQALQFLARYESELVTERNRLGQDGNGYIAQKWFVTRAMGINALDEEIPEISPDSTQVAQEVAKINQQVNVERRIAGPWMLHLDNLVVGAFDAYVPRKLIRVVELFHQVLEVTHQRGRPVNEYLNGARDPRWILVFVMLQLFQPDLYRLLRRQGRGADVLIDGFKEKELKPDMADMDLLAWASFASDSEEPKPTDLKAAIERIAREKDEGKRSPAQRLRLPIVERLLDHRSTQRHVFDPLKLFAAVVQDDAPDPWTRSYFGLLAELPSQVGDHVPQAVVFKASSAHFSIPMATVQASAVVSDTEELCVVVDMDRLFAALTSAEASDRRALAETVGLQVKQQLDGQQVQTLAKRLADWRVVGSSEIEKSDRLLRLRDGLHYLAPFVAPSDGSVLWEATGLAKPIWEPTTAYSDVETLKQAARDADLFVALRQDDRFDPNRFYLPCRSQSEQADGREPIAGFVRVPKGQFTLGAEEVGFHVNPLNTSAEIQSDFYMARYLTTVDQFAHFVAQKGYGDPAGEKPEWWDTLGWQWRIGQWDSQVKEKAYRDHLTSRTPEQRGAPMNWAEQLAHGSHPVMRINWFEARAYARWLTQQLNTELQQLPAGYAVRLPTEAQWERAARAKDFTVADDRQYPWGGQDQKTAHLQANIGASDIGRVSPVGLFTPNPLGLCDLSGNAWEWQNNLYTTDGSGQDKGLVSDVEQLKTHAEFDKCDLPALRGGACVSTTDVTRMSFRNRDLPADPSLDVGFRVVFSLSK